MPARRPNDSVVDPFDLKKKRNGENHDPQPPNPSNRKTCWYCNVTFINIINQGTQACWMNGLRWYLIIISVVMLSWNRWNRGILSKGLSHECCHGSPIPILGIEWECDGAICTLRLFWDLIVAAFIMCGDAALDPEGDLDALIACLLRAAGEVNLSWRHCQKGESFSSVNYPRVIHAVWFIRNSL